MNGYLRGDSSLCLVGNCLSSVSLLTSTLCHRNLFLSLCRMLQWLTSAQMFSFWYWQAILPYCQALQKLAPHIQQVPMQFLVVLFSFGFGLLLDVIFFSVTVSQDKGSSSSRPAWATSHFDTSASHERPLGLTSDGTLCRHKLMGCLICIVVLIMFCSGFASFRSVWRVMARGSLLMEKHYHMRLVKLILVSLVPMANTAFTSLYIR